MTFPYIYDVVHDLQSMNVLQQFIPQDKLFLLFFYMSMCKQMVVTILIIPLTF